MTVVRRFSILSALLTVGGLLLAASLVPAAAQQEPAPDTGWLPLPPDEARLYIEPSAFGTQGIRRLVREVGGMRYERWSTRFDLDLRSFQVVLYQPEIPAFVPNPPSVRDIVTQMLAGTVDQSISWGESQEIVTGLGLAEVLGFQLAGEVGCAGFIIDLPGGTAHGIQGLYCDPISSILPTADIEETLKSIGVDGVFMPGPI